MSDESEPTTGALPRLVAAEGVFEVLERGAFVAAALDQQLLLHPEIGPRDAALATELAYGVVRHLGALRSRLDARTKRGVRDPRIGAHLLVAIYQLCLLDRVPAFAAVNVAVAAAKRIGGPKVAGFANAVLRRLAREPKLDRALSLRESVPNWLLQSVEASLSSEHTEALFGLESEAPLPRTTARFRGEAALPAWAEAGEPGRFLPFVRSFRRAGDLRRHPEWREGQFVLQEEGATLCALALSVRPGEKVLDACAGRGQKASLLSDRITTLGELWVSDKKPAKLAQLTSEFERLGLPRPKLHVVGGETSLPDDFDRVLVDAPCSGTGTLRHRPEITLRLGPDDPGRLAELALTITLEAAARLRPGGTLLFVVCSVLERECEQVARELIRRSPNLRPEAFPPSEFQRLVPDGAAQFRLLPDVHGTDGYFLAHFRKHPAVLTTAPRSLS
jgi:16S rRNA (cytosine967-C5)-methyltransferase